MYKCLSRLVLNKTNYTPNLRFSGDIFIKDNPGSLGSVQKRLIRFDQTTTIASQQIHKYSSTNNSTKTSNDILRKSFSFQNGIQSKFNSQLHLPSSMFHGRNPIFQSYSFNSSTYDSQSALPYRQFSCSSHFKTTEPSKENKKEGIIVKFKKMWKDYWYVVIPVHVVTSIGWYGGFYLLIKSGVDIPAILEWIGTSEVYLEKLQNSNLGTFALMFACYKIATPIRYTVTVGGSTWTIRYLSKRGLMTSNKLKDELTERSGQLKKLDDGLQHAKHRYKDMREEFQNDYERAWEMFAKRRRKP